MFSAYLKEKRAALILYFLFLGIFAVIYFLYGLPTGAFLYPAAVCSAMGAVYLVFNYIGERKKYKALSHIKDFTDVKASPLPAASSPAESAYAALTERLTALNAGQCSEYERAMRGTNEYYTLWVHQIKTPLSVMRLLLRDEDSDNSRRLRAELARTERYVGMVLAYIRLNSSDSDYVIKEYSLDGIISAALKSFSAEFISRGIKLDYRPTEIKVITDEKWLLFVIEQILSNALKYTKKGKVSVYARGEELHISDTGIGIAACDLPRIFESGYTGGNGRTDMSASGIGLYLCKRICSKLGHGISARSEVGKGTDISIDLSRRKTVFE